jgi:hypothetical protein
MPAFRFITDGEDRLAAGRGEDMRDHDGPDPHDQPLDERERRRAVRDIQRFRDGFVRLHRRLL